jgi:hypothetical protein
MSPSVPPDRPAGPHRSWLAAAAAAGSALVALTWLLAQGTLRQQMAAMQSEIDLCRSSRGLNLPVLLKDLNRFAAAASSRQEGERLKQRLQGLEADQGRALAELAQLKLATSPEERFHLASGRNHDLLAGQVAVAVTAVRVDGADVGLAGAAASPWKIGEFRDLRFGDGPYRLKLEATRASPPRATFRLEALKSAAKASNTDPQQPSP